MVKKKKEVNKESATIPIKWCVPDDVISRYANNMLVQALENEFKILFFETKFPIRLNSKDPVPKEVRSDCVVSIVINPAKIPAFVKALQQQYDNFIAKQSTEKPQEQTKELTT